MVAAVGATFILEQMDRTTSGRGRGYLGVGRTIPHFSLERWGIKAENRESARKGLWIATIHPCLEDKYGFIWTTKEEL